MHLFEGAIMNDTKEPPAWIASLLLTFAAFLFVILIMLMIKSRIDTAQSIVETIKKDTTTEFGHLIGKVKTVENYKAENAVIKEGNATLELYITDRTKITFEDGRTKELLGIPEKAIPTDREIVIIWAKYDIYLKYMEIADYKKE